MASIRSMVIHKYLEVYGSSKESFADAANRAVKEAAKTIRGIDSGEVTKIHFKVKNNKIVEYNSSLKLAFEVER